MKLHEEFKLYENMWESEEISAIVFVGNERNEDALLSKVAKVNPAHTTTVYSIGDFLRECDVANREAVRAVKFYTDTEGMTELEKACANMPERLKRGILDKTTLIEEARSLKEAVPTTTHEIMNRYQDNVADHIVELEHEKAFEDAEWFENGWYVLENVEVYPDYYKLIVDRPIESDIDAEAIISYAFEPANIVSLDEAMSEGGVIYDEGDNWIYIERWVVEQDKTVTESSEFTAQSEHDEHDFKKGFISYLLKKYPKYKTAWEVLSKFDFRASKGGVHYVKSGFAGLGIDLQNGVIELPKSYIEEKSYEYAEMALGNYVSNFRRLMKSLQPLFDVPML